MTTRRRALQTTALAAAAAAIDTTRVFGQGSDQTRVSRRPAPAERRFTSPTVEATITAVERDIADPELAWLFGNCFPAAS